MNPKEYEAFYTQRLEKTAFILGLFSIVSTFVFPVLGPFILGSLAMVYAILSKGGNLKFSRRGRNAFLLGAVAIVLNIGYLVFSYQSLRLLLTDPSGRQQINDLLYQQYGMTLDELLQQLPQQPFIN